MKTGLQLLGGLFVVCCLAWVSNVHAKKAKNPFLPTRAHIPKGQQLGVYFLPWDDNGPVLAVRFFLSKDNVKGSLPLEAAFVDDSGSDIWREEISGAVDLAFWGEAPLGGNRVHIDFADDGAILISLKDVAEWGKENPQYQPGGGWHVAPIDKRVGAQLMIAAPPPSLDELKTNWRVRRGLLAGKYRRSYGWVVVRELNTSEPVSALVWPAGEGVAWAQMNHKGEIELEYLNALASQYRRKYFKGGVPERDASKWERARYDLLNVTEKDRCIIPATFVISGFQDMSGYQISDAIYTRCEKDSIYGRLTIKRMWGQYQKLATQGLWVQF